MFITIITLNSLFWTKYSRLRVGVPSKAPMKKIIGLLIILNSLLFSFSAVLSWNYNPETNIVLYKVHSGQASRNYSSVNSAGNTNNYLIPFSTNTTYFAVSALDSNGLESELSDEVVYQIENLKLSIRLRNNKPEIYFQAEANKEYFIETCLDLNLPTWTFYFSLLKTNNEEVVIPITNQMEKVFFRAYYKYP